MPGRRNQVDPRISIRPAQLDEYRPGLRAAGRGIERGLRQQRIGRRLAEVIEHQRYRYVRQLGQRQRQRTRVDVQLEMPAQRMGGVQYRGPCRVAPHRVLRLADHVPAQPGHPMPVELADLFGRRVGAQHGHAAQVGVSIERGDQFAIVGAQKTRLNDHASIDSLSPCQCLPGLVSGGVGGSVTRLRRDRLRQPEQVKVRIDSGCLGDGHDPYGRSVGSGPVATTFDATPADL